MSVDDHVKDATRTMAAKLERTMFEGKAEYAGEFDRTWSLDIDEFYKQIEDISADWMKDFHEPVQMQIHPDIYKLMRKDMESKAAFKGIEFIGKVPETTEFRTSGSDIEIVPNPLMPQDKAIMYGKGGGGMNKVELINLGATSHVEKAPPHESEEETRFMEELEKI